MTTLKRNHFCSSPKAALQKDFPELKNVRVQWTVNGETFMAVIQDANYDIGISVVHEDNPKKPCLCMPGPSAPNWSRSENSKPSHNWDKIFYTTIAEIKSGVYVGKWKDTITGYSRAGGSISTCPFNV